MLFGSLNFNPPNAKLRPELSVEGPMSVCELDPAGNILAWDGRLDNGRELRRQHGLPQASDAAIALSIVQRGPITTFGEFIGDWSAVSWDEARSSLVLASDYIGVRPLYYCYQQERLTWSSSLAQLQASVPACDIDEDYAAEFLERGGSWNRTPYRGIRVVPPGHAVCVTRAGIEIHAFWKCDWDEIHFAQEQDYAFRLRELLEEAVAVRIQNAGDVYAELSGGLDSSAVFCVAHRLMRDGRAKVGSLIPVHYDHPGSQDRRFHEILQSTLGVRSVCIGTETHPFIASDAAGFSAPEWWERRYTHMDRHTRGGAPRVFLTGRLGDLVMGNYLDDSEQVADLLRAFSPRRAFCQAMDWSRLLHLPVYGVLCRALQSGLFGREFPSRAPFTAPGWSHISPSRQKHVRLLCDAIASRTLQTPEPLQKFSYTHPFTHRPLVEFMMRIPSNALCAPGEPRKLMRAALKDLLPAAVLARRSKASFEGVFRSALQPLAACLLRRPGDIRLVSRGWMDGKSLTCRLERFLHGLDCNEGQLRHAILFEFWMRNFERRQSLGTGQSALAV